MSFSTCCGIQLGSKWILHHVQNDNEKSFKVDSRLRGNYKNKFL